MNIINSYRFGAAAFNGFGNASRLFDGTNDYIDLGDSDDFSFGDSSTDSPFSVCAWVKMVDATLFRIVCKQDNTTTGAEWLLSTGGNDKLYWALYDLSTNIYRGLTSAATLTTHESSWIHIAATYDGTGGNLAQDGMTMYLTEKGGSTSALSTVDFTAGTYTAMHNTAQPAYIGEFNNTYSDGKISDVRIYNKELTSSEVQNLADGVHVSDSLVSWWLDDDDDVLDNAGTNDGTNNGSTYSTDGPNG